VSGEGAQPERGRLAHPTHGGGQDARAPVGEHAKPYGIPGDGARQAAPALGVVLMLWGDNVSAATEPLLRRVAAIGYDLIELPLFGADEPDLAEVRRRVAGAGLRCTVNTALPPGLSLLQPEKRTATVDFLGRIAGQARALGTDLVCGPLLEPVGDLPDIAPGPRERESASAGLLAAAQRAADVGVTLALEPLNRFESAFPTTVAEACTLVDSVGATNLGLLLDTFHMNIEERDPAAAIRQAGRRLRHFHCSENDRGPVGSGHVNWQEIRDALLATGYGGDLAVESFGNTVPAISRACCIWRPLAADPATLAQESATYLRRLWAGKGLGG
jgi:D-psicose/D-tagatose/L-ribulose 3-epimerase